MAAAEEEYAALAEGRDAVGRRLVWSDYVTNGPLVLSGEDPRVQRFQEHFEDATYIWVYDGTWDRPIIFADGDVFTAFQHLTRIHLSGSTVRADANGHDPELLDKIVSKLPALEHLEAGLPGYQIRISQPVLSPALKSITLSYCPSTPIIAPVALRSLGRSLVELDLFHCEHFEWPPEWSDALTKLERLMLIGVWPLPAVSVDRLSNLRVLCIRQCQLLEFPRNLHRLKRLDDVEIRDNVGLRSVPHTIGQLAMFYTETSLQGGARLHLGGNALPHIPAELYPHMLLRSRDAKRDYLGAVSAKDNPYPLFAAPRRRDAILSLHPPTSLLAIAAQRILKQAAIDLKTHVLHGGPDQPLPSEEAWMAEYPIPIELQEHIAANWKIGIRCMSCGAPCLQTSWRMMYGRKMPFTREDADDAGLEGTARIEYSPHVFEAYLDTPTCMRSFFVLGDTVERYERSRAREAPTSRDGAKRARV